MHHHRWVRHVDDGQLVQSLGVLQGHGPCDGSSPIMACQIEALATKLVGNGEDIASQQRYSVIADRRWLAAQVVAALVESDDSEACGR